MGFYLDSNVLLVAVIFSLWFHDRHIATPILYYKDELTCNDGI